jgi:hypothetical protein
VLGRGLSLSSVRSLKSKTGRLRRRHTTGEDAGVRPEENSSVGRRLLKMVGRS